MKISVQKYNPSVDAEPYFGTYEIEHTEHMTLLEALVVINDTIEPIAFDYSCRGRVCGRCAMTLNGTPCLACVTWLRMRARTKSRHSSIFRWCAT